MPLSPCTPPRPRKPSNPDHALSSPPSTQNSPAEKYATQTFSIHSVPSPLSNKSLSTRDSFGVDRSGMMDGSDGLGNLADELAEAWDDDGGTTSQIEHVFGEHGGNGLSDDKRGRPILKIHHDAGISVPNTFRLDADDNQLLSPPNQLISSRRQGAASFPSDYDGSDYGDDSDLENTEGISASLEYRLAAIEGLARRGTEANGSGADTAVLRVAESLRDLASQAGVETGASRLTTAHTAVTSNLAHQTRLMQKLSHQFTSPYSLPPAPDEADEVLSLVAAILELLPPPSPRAVAALHTLYSSAADLVSTLSMLADSLHMIRQTTALASRKLKAAKEAVDELRRETRIREEGVRWVERGNWDQKLSNRECGSICGDMVDGFRQVCEQWEKTIREDVTGHEALEVAAG